MKRSIQFSILFICTVLLTHIAQAGNMPAGNILIWGDSLSAGYGIARQDAWPSRLAGQLQAAGYAYTIVNASISGETTAGGLQRLPAALARYKPAIVVLELGANDGLRGLSLKAMRNNLAQMIMLAQASHAEVLLIGMRLPPNYGQTYTDQFASIYAELAAAHHTALLPFLLDGFAQTPELFIGDNIHPTAEAQKLVLKNVWNKLQALLKK